MAPRCGPKIRKSFPGNWREKKLGGFETESEACKLACANFFLPISHHPAVPTPESPGQCLRLQVSVCCKEDSEWVGAGEQPFWLVWGPQE